MTKLEEFLNDENYEEEQKPLEKEILYINKGEDYHLNFDQIVYKDGTTEII